MADLPIPFSAPMVQALLREIVAPGTGKTQTRRVLKPASAKVTLTPRLERPRYSVGDRLYVREHWRTHARLDATAPRDLTPRSVTIDFEAGGSIAEQPGKGWWPMSDNHPVDQMGRFRQGMHMPRWASRITLIVTGVKVERLQDCSEADAVAEGMIWSEPTDKDRQWALDYADEHGGGADIRGVWLAPGTRQGYGTNREQREGMQWGPTAAFAYRCVWESLHGPGAWEANPWVAAYTFRPLLGNIDTIKEGGRNG